MPAILAVDSSWAVTGLLKAILEPGGFEVTVSDNAEEAIEQYRDGDFDLVLSAIPMEPVNGFMLLEKMLQIDADALVILMMSNPTKEVAIEAFERGAFGFQERPFKIKELIEDINRGVDHRRRKDAGLTQEGAVKRLRRRYEKEIREKEKAVEEIIKEADETREAAERARIAVEASQQLLEERQAFLEMSENTLAEKSRVLSEIQVELEQLREEISKQSAGAIEPEEEPLEIEVDPETDFSEEDLALFESVFKDFSPLDFMRLMEIASWVDYVPNETIITQGEQVQNLSLIFDGAVKVSKDGTEIAELSNLDFIGDMSFTTKNPASATVTTGVQTKVVSWPIDVLNRKLDSSTSLRSSLHAVIGVALTRKLVGNL